ncbi:hypothetical protein LINPERPRIM_LOCUS10972, partial [Linum perenne]
EIRILPTKVSFFPKFKILQKPSSLSILFGFLLFFYTSHHHHHFYAQPRNAQSQTPLQKKKEEAEKRRRIYLTSQEDSYKYDQINKEVIKETLAYEDVFIILLCTLFRIDYN